MQPIFTINENILISYVLLHGRGGDRLIFLFWVIDNLISYEPAFLFKYRTAP